MADINELKAGRRAKVRALRAEGINPYPEKTPKRTSIKDVLAKFSTLKRLRKRTAVVGRIMGIRGHGGALFLDVVDASGRIQVLASKRVIGAKKFAILALFDLGDIVAVAGLPMTTRRGEKSIEAKSITLLTKSIRPLPDSWYGLKDVDERFRDREVDFLLNEHAREGIIMRGKLLVSLRESLAEAGFLEVETPILQSIPGGAAARPFKTKLHALNIPLYLRIAPELYLKRLIVGGFEQVYELGRAFRNEGMDKTHNPEFTILEFYWAYQDFKGLLAFTEKMLRRAVKDATGGTTITYQGKRINFGKKFARVEYRTVFAKHVGVDPIDATNKALVARAKRFGVPTKGAVRAQIIDHLFKKVVAEELPEPCFLLHHPLELSPLAKTSLEDPATARRLQVVVGGFEIVNAYAELNDPDEQAKRFAGEAKRRRAGDREAHPNDADFIRALEYGMPPTAGFGLGVDRFLMLLTDAASVREIIAFPTMRPRKRS